MEKKSNSNLENIVQVVNELVNLAAFNSMTPEELAESFGRALAHDIVEQLENEEIEED